ncbi:hypothetical protein [Capnocytophaga cynodegmi]
MTTKQKLPQEAYYSVMGFLAPISKVHKIIDNYLYQRKNEQKQTKNDL